MRRLIPWFIALFIGFGSFASWGGGPVLFFRDTEIENFLYAIVRPLAQAAGLGESAIRIYLLGKDEVNAAASGDGRIFINIGFLLKMENVSQLRGVLAHEMGHITAHHGARREDLQKKLSTASIAALFLGVGLGITTKRPDLGIGTMIAGSSMALHALFYHSRQEETAADVCAVSLLKKLGYSPKGLIDALMFFHSLERLTEGETVPYFRTHPGTQERIDALRDHLPATPDPLPSPKEEEDYRYIKKKLFAFWASLDRVRKEVGGEEVFPRAIALYRQGELSEALALIEKLLAQTQNPYWLELKAQILLEQKNAHAATQAYREVLALFPDAKKVTLIQLALAHALLETEEENSLDEVSTLLNAIKETERENPQLWHLLAEVYHRKKDLGHADLALAEKAWALGEGERAHHKALQAQKHLKKGSPGWKRTNDLLKEIEEAHDLITPQEP
ncbi:MAG: M48 family metalloprotease [Holosporales bacterium]|jgi:predicted Zn-dependent protease|nr:M48 family metalloprotease [Holosporales bacterium]